MSSRHMWLFAEGVVNILSPVLLALALRMVGLNGEGTWFMQGSIISSITISTVVMLLVIWEMVPHAIFFVALGSILIRIIRVYKDYMIIVLPLLDLMMHILSQLKMDEEKRTLLDLIMHIWSQLKMDGGKRSEKSRVDGGRQLSMMSQQTMDQEEHIDKSRVDGRQLITSMTSRQMMDKREQIESSRVDEQHLTSMTSQQTMNLEDQAESSRLHGQKIDEGEITRVDEQQLTSMTSNEIQIMEQEEQIEITRVGEQQYVLTRQQTTDQQEQIESSRIDEQHLTSTKSQQRMDREVKLFGVHNQGLAMTILLYLQVVPGLLRASSQYGALVQAGMFVVSLLALCSQMQSSVWSHSRFAGTENYIISASVVITAYGMLLLINMSYIKIIIVPIAILIFIAALWNKLRLKSGLKMDSGYYVKDVSKRVEELLVLTALPYCALYFEAIFPTNSLALSHFLWFLSSSLGAVAVMIALLPVAKSPGGAQVLQIFYRTCITVLTITVHTEAAEWAREDTALVFTPELVTVLVWFTIPFRLGVSDLSIYSGISRKSIVAVVFVVLRYTASPAYPYNGRTRALRACSFSGCLTYFSMCMLRQWPGSKPVSQVPVKLLKFFAKNCFSAAAVLAVMSPRHGDFINYMLVFLMKINYMLVDAGRAILSCVCLFLFLLLLGPAENKRRFLRDLVPIVAAGRRFIHLSQRLHSSLIYLYRGLKQCAQWLGETPLIQAVGNLTQ